MIQSMTAFCRSSCPLDVGLLSIEIQSLNRKHLEVQTVLPREFLELDALIKKQIQKRLARGKVNLYLSFIPHSGQGIELIPNLAIAEQIQKGWRAISEHLTLNEKESGLIQLLTHESHLFESKVDPDFAHRMEKEVLSLLEKTLDGLCEMRKQEGRYLKEEFEKRVALLEEFLREVRSLNHLSAQKQQEKLKERVTALLESTLQEDERFYKEVAFLVDKSDITEEMTRLQSHLKQFMQVLNEPQNGHGKMLDFITQELGREWNTIGAKCADHQISQIVIQAKSECEKIREQIQNIE